MRTWLFALLVVVLGSLAALMCLPGETRTRAQTLSADTAELRGPVDAASPPLAALPESVNSRVAPEMPAELPQSTFAPAPRTRVADAAVSAPPPEPGMIQGRVTAERGFDEISAGKKIALSATRDAGPRESKGAWTWDRHDAQVAPDGRFELTSLALGHWRVSAALREHEEITQEIELTLERPNAELDFHLRANRLVRITLLDQNGAPWTARKESDLPGWWPTLRPYVTTDCSASTLSRGSLKQSASSTRRDRAGTWYAVHFEPTDTACVQVLLGEVEIAHAPAPLGVEDVSITIDESRVQMATCTLKLHVADDRGQPVAAEATLRASMVAARSEPSTADGLIAFDGIPRGRAALSITARGFVKRTLDVQVSEERGNEIAIELERAVTLSGRVVNVGTGRAQVSVARIESWTAAPTGTNGSAWANPDGSFQIEGLRPGAYIVAPYAFFSGHGGPDESWPAPNSVVFADSRGFVIVDASAGDVQGVVLPARAEPEVPAAAGHRIRH